MIAARGCRPSLLPSALPLPAAANYYPALRAASPVVFGHSSASTSLLGACWRSVFPAGEAICQTN